MQYFHAMCACSHVTERIISLVTLKQNMEEGLKENDVLDAQKRVKTQEHVEPEVENDGGGVKRKANDVLDAQKKI
jgi:hypothetical protein